ncbi:MAG: hypothetical protein ABI690_13655 [Chloroflexota bacterium]
MLDLQIYDLLRRLENDHANGFPWVGSAQFQDIPADKQDRAVSAGYVKEKGFGNIRQYRLTEIGKNEANFTATEMLRRMQSDSDDLGDVDEAVSVQRGRIRSLIQPLGEPIVIHADEPASNGHSVPVEPEISVSVYGETLGADDPAVPALEALATIFGGDPDAAPVGTRYVSSAAGVKTCCEPGCDQPRHLNYNRCKAHQQAVWRDRSASQRDVEKPARKRRSAPITETHVAIVEPPITDEDTQPDIIPVNTPIAKSLTPSLYTGRAGEGFLTRALARAVVRFILIAKGG